LGRALKVDAVMTGRFRTKGSRLIVKPLLMRAASGKLAKGKILTLDRDIEVPVPELFVAAPILDRDEALRDAVSAQSAPSCEDAADRVDSYEKHILDVKARYWALQLSRGVAMQGLKFNPGSTISDPFLKQEFYERMKEWRRQAIIPEL